MGLLDLIIVFGYLVGITLFGIWFAGKQETTEDYFVGDRSVPWWAIAASIVATETSTITFISVPGVAFSRGGNFQFLQLVLGYMLGRVVISLLFIPSYFRGELLTVYELLERRFGGRIKMLAAALFVVMRNIADGIRLLLTAIVLAAVYTAFQPQANVATVTVASIVLLGAVMVVFTYYGGIEAVIWVEVVQLGIYLAGALAAALILVSAIGGGFDGAREASGDVRREHEGRRQGAREEDAELHDLDPDDRLHPAEVGEDDHHHAEQHDRGDDDLRVVRAGHEGRVDGGEESAVRSSRMPSAMLRMTTKSEAANILMRPPKRRSRSW